MKQATQRYVDALHVAPPHTAHVGAYVATLIVDQFPREKAPPTVQQLMERFGMRRATAYRWRAAICAARGIDSALHCCEGEA